MNPTETLMETHGIPGGMMVNVAGSPACSARWEHSGIPSRMSRGSQPWKAPPRDLSPGAGQKKQFWRHQRGKQTHRGVKVGSAPLLDKVPSRTLIRIVSTRILSAWREGDSTTPPSSLFQAPATHRVLLMFRWNVLLPSPTLCLWSCSSAPQGDPGSILLPYPPCSWTPIPHPSPHPPAGAAGWWAAPRGAAGPWGTWGDPAMRGGSIQVQQSRGCGTLCDGSLQSRAFPSAFPALWAAPQDHRYFHPVGQVFCCFCQTEVAPSKAQSSCAVRLLQSTPVTSTRNKWIMTPILLLFYN